MSFFSEDRASELRDLFFESAAELLQSLNDQGLELERRPGDAETVRQIRRTVHTLKGDAAACGFQEMSSLAHHLEDGLTQELAVRHGVKVAEAVLHAADAFGEMLHAYRHNTEAPSGEGVRRFVDALVHGSGESAAQTATATPVVQETSRFQWTEYEQMVISEAASRGLKVTQLSLDIDPVCLVKAAAVQMVKSALQELGNLLAMHPDEHQSVSELARIEAALTTSFDAAHITRKVQIPSVIAQAVVEPYGAAKEAVAAEAPKAPAPAPAQADLDLFREAASTLATSLTLDELYRHLMEMVTEYFQPDNWSLLLVDEDRQELRFEIATGPVADQLKKMRLKIGEGIAGWVAQHGKAVVAPDVYSDRRFASRFDEMVKFRTQSMICVPLRSKGRTLGVIQLVNCPVDKFDERKMTFLQTLCDFAGAGIENVRAAEAQMPAAAVSGERVTADTSSTLRVDAERIDTILNLVGELIIGKSMLTQAVGDFDRAHAKDPLRAKFADALSFQARTLNDLQKAVMKVRMVPVDQLFRRFPRVVRDVGKVCGKDVSLAISGQDTDLDKSVLDLLAEPLAHMVRNAISHGIESPEERAAAGKPAQGTLRLSAYHQGNSVVLEVSDDGRGIDRQKVAQVAVEKGIVNADEIARMTEGETLDLIFRPGFSTAQEVTSVAGRGVGMDVVKSVVDQLKGTVAIETTVGAGTRFFIKVPLTLAIIKALMFRVADKLYAIPLASVVEITRAQAEEVHRVDQHEVLRLREEVITLVRLDALAQQPMAMRKKMFVVVLSLSDRKFGLVVDKLVGEEELVIKAMDDHVVMTDYVSGASILGDGTVVLILNIQTLVSRLGRSAVATPMGASA